MKKLFGIIVILSLIAITAKSENIIEKVGKIATSLIDKKDNKSVAPTSKETSNIKYTNNAKVSNFIDERRIYLIDLTRSMEGYKGSENIFDNLKNQLRQTIGSLNDTTTEIYLIPFTNKVQGQFNCTLAKKDSILNYIDGLKTMMGDTNILDAWKRGVELLDSTKINYMFMLTDGIHNTGDPVDSLYHELQSWHHKARGKYQFAFYVLLSEGAKEQEVCRIVDASKQMWLVPSMNLQVNFIVGKMNQSVNINNITKVKIHLTCTDPEIFNRGFRFKITLPENEYYKIKDADEVLDANGFLSFIIEKLKPQSELPVSYKTKLNVSYDNAKYPFVFFTPEEYNLNIVNVGTRKMIIKSLKK